jgi:hypothetical protein
MNKFIKFGVTLLTGVAVFFALSGDRKSEGSEKCNPSDNFEGPNTSDQDNRERRNQKSNSDPSGTVKAVQGVFNKFSGLFQTLMNLALNYSKVVNTSPNHSNYRYTSFNEDGSPIWT